VLLFFLCVGIWSYFTTRLPTFFFSFIVISSHGFLMVPFLFPPLATFRGDSGKFFFSPPKLEGQLMDRKDSLLSPFSLKREGSLPSFLLSSLHPGHHGKKTHPPFFPGGPNFIMEVCLPLSFFAWRWGKEFFFSLFFLHPALGTRSDDLISILPFRARL